MPPPIRIPEPVYLEAQVTGAITEMGDLYIAPEPPAAEPVVAHGMFVIRAAIPLIVPANDALIMGLFISERGQMFTGQEAWAYLQRRFQMHPRADVIGLTLNGAPHQVLVKALDFGAPVRILAYADPPGSAPVAEVTRLYTDDATFSALPDWLKANLPRG